MTVYREGNNAVTILVEYAEGLLKSFELLVVYLIIDLEHPLSEEIPHCATNCKTFLTLALEPDALICGDAEVGCCEWSSASCGHVGYT